MVRHDAGFQGRHVMVNTVMLSQTNSLQKA